MGVFVKPAQRLEKASSSSQGGKEKDKEEEEEIEKKEDEEEKEKSADGKDKDAKEENNNEEVYRYFEMHSVWFYLSLNSPPKLCRVSWSFTKIVDRSIHEVSILHINIFTS